MSAAEDTLCGVLRHMFTWPDRVLVRDWTSALGAIPARMDGDVLAELVERYLQMRRTAPGWSPKRYDRNNHRNISNEAVVALLLDANRTDKDTRGLRKKSRRTGRPRFRCVVCHTRFAAERSTARYCSESCKQKAKRRRESGFRGPQSAERGTGGPHLTDTLAVRESTSERPTSQEAP